MWHPIKTINGVSNCQSAKDAVFTQTLTQRQTDHVMSSASAAHV